jgi:hypothetical protein
MQQLTKICTEYEDNRFALSFLADIYAETENMKCIDIWTLLAEKYDDLRVNYWKWKIEQYKATHKIKATA